MVKKGLVVISIFILVTLLATLSFSFNFGGGGPVVYYFPGGEFLGSIKNINIPILDLSKFEDGIIALGGYGYGGVPNMSYSGGFGFSGEREYNVSGKVYKVIIDGGFGAWMKKIDMGSFSISTSIGFGGIDLSIQRKVNEGNTSINDLENGTLEGYLGASIGYLTVSGDLGFIINLGFLELKIGAIAFLGYSSDGWLVNGKKLQGLTENYNILANYALYGGIGFGF